MSRFDKFLDEKCGPEHGKKKKKKMEEAKGVKKLPYEAKIYIQEEGDKHLVYLSMGGTEWYAEVENKQKALKLFKDLVSRVTSKMNMI